MKNKSWILVFLTLTTCVCGRLTAGPWKAIGPSGGNFNVIQISPSDPQLIYAGTMWGGLYKTTNAGDNWNYVGFRGEKIISSIAFDPHDPDKVFFSWYTSSGSYSSGVIKSIDGGQSWQALPIPSARTLGTTVGNSCVVFVGSDNGLFRSTDGGSTFDSIAYRFGYNNFSAIAGDPKDSSVVFVGTDNAVYKSTDEGTTWQLLTNVYQFDTYSAYVDAITISPRNQTVLVSTELAGLFISPDGGTGWSQWNFGNQVHGAFCDAHEDSTIYAVTLGGFLKSVNMGHTFSLVKAGYFQGGSTQGEEMVLFDADSGVIFRTTDAGKSWSDIVNGITDVSIYSMLVQPGGDRSLLAILSKGYGAQLLAYRDAEWDTIAFAYYSNYSGGRLYESADQSIFYMIGGWNYVARSSDWGKTWNSGASGLPYCSPTDLAIAQDTLYLAATYSFEGNAAGIYKSTDRGVTWAYSITGLPVYSIAVDRFDGRTVYAGGGDGAFYRSTDGGTSWAQVSLLVGSYAQQILTGLDSARRVFVVGQSLYGNGCDTLYRSTNGGRTFATIGCGLKRVLCITCASDQKTLYVGGYSGVVRSTDAGLSWQAVGGGLDSVNVTCIVQDPSSGVLYCGTAEGGAYQLDVPNAVLNNSSGASPTAYTLLQNYPNPYNPVTTISYGLPQQSMVRLSIFNTLGQELITLVDQIESAGLKSVQFDARNLSSGVYFYRLEARNPSASSGHGFTDIKKMLLLK